MGSYAARQILSYQEAAWRIAQEDALLSGDDIAGMPLQMHILFDT
jgi:hypothetical protein